VEGRRAAKAGKLLDKREYGKALAEATNLLASDRTGEEDRKSAQAITDDGRYDPKAPLVERTRPLPECKSNSIRPLKEKKED
jgi:hypothetical protein